MAIWSILNEEGLRRSMGTLAVIAFGSLLFMDVNLAFGTLEESELGSLDSPDSAFGERLKKAKDLRVGE